MEKALTNEQEAIRRCEYASQLLSEANIPHEIKKKEIGHINLLGYVKAEGKIKPVMSFWARTGKYIFLRTPKEPIEIGDCRGIQNCMKSYRRFIEMEQE